MWECYVSTTKDSLQGPNSLVQHIELRELELIVQFLANYQITKCGTCGRWYSKKGDCARDSTISFTSVGELNNQKSKTNYKYNLSHLTELNSVGIYVCSKGSWWYPTDKCHFSQCTPTHVTLLVRVPQSNYTYHNLNIKNCFQTTSYVELGIRYFKFFIQALVDLIFKLSRGSLPSDYHPILPTVGIF